MTIDGELTEYNPSMSERCEPANPAIVAHFRFEHAHINDEWQIDSGSIIDLETNLRLQPDQLLLESVEATIEDTFGRAWLEVWKQNLDNTQDPIFALENGKVRYTRFPKQAIDYRKLDKAKLMAGTVFGNYPGSDEPASNQWCQIMNIPTDYSKETLDAQTIIATNCGRSIKRYCDPYSGFPSGQRQASPPLVGAIPLIKAQWQTL
ncbi:hypothetical protein JCM19236_6630 [Vibrio sp. JCM 19236]|nr:hypothetical protein JCM19236_6630 [Vibrio sp. JCM 19236]